MGTHTVDRVVIDTNVIVSALLFGGVPGKLMELWKCGAIRPCLSREIADELIRVLAYPKFALTEGEIGFLLRQEVLPFFEIVTVTETPAVIAADPSDDKFVACASKAGAAVIVTGDRHLLELGEFQGIRMVPPARFLADRPKA